MDDNSEQNGKADLKRSRRVKANLVDVSKLDRPAPFSLEAEQGVLGCIFLDPNRALGECITRFKAGAEVFYDPRHRTLYELLVDMYEVKDPIELISVGQKLRDTNQLDAVGGLVYLSQLDNAVPSAANLEYYAEIIRDKYLLRRVIGTCTEAVGQAYTRQDEVDAFFDEVEKNVLQIRQEKTVVTIRSIKDLVNKAVEQVEDFLNRKGAMTGLTTGFKDLDKLTSGLQKGDMVVIAARPSMGKTSLAMNIVEHVALDSRIPVGVFSLEMTAESLVMRMLCSRARVNLRSLRDGFMSERDFPKLSRSASEMTGAPIFIDDTAGLSIMQLRARARRMWQQHQIGLFVIDYLQLLNSTSRRAENRQQEIADISNGVKALAKELSVPVIVLSQLNRDMEKEKNRKPRLSDLRESGAIEQDADLVGLLYKSGGGEEDGESAPVSEDDGIPVNLLIAKQRNGPTGDVSLVFLKNLTRFEDMSPVHDVDVSG